MMLVRALCIGRDVKVVLITRKLGADDLEFALREGAALAGFYIYYIKV
jgi:hypothetical protein